MNRKEKKSLHVGRLDLVKSRADVMTKQSLKNSALTYAGE